MSTILPLRFVAALDPSQCHFMSFAHSRHGVSYDGRDGQRSVTNAEADDISIRVLLQVSRSPSSDL